MSEVPAPISPSACKAARALAGLTQRQLAEGAHLSTQTVADFERGARTPHPNNIRAIVATLEQRGIEFIVENGVVIGVQQRATG